MPEIKIKQTFHDVKVLDRAALAGKRMKSAAIRTKEKAEESANSQEQSNPSVYASEQIQSVSVAAITKASQAGKKGIQKIEKKVKERQDTTPESSSPSQQEERGYHVNSQTRPASPPRQETAPVRESPLIRTKPTAKSRWQAEQNNVKSSDPVERGREYTKQQSKKRMELLRTPEAKEIRQTVHTVQEAHHFNPKAPKTRQVISRTIKKREAAQARKAARKTVKATERTIKTAEKTTKTAIKTAKQAEKAAQKAAEASAKAARAAAHAAKVAVKEAIVLAKALGKALVALVKAIVAALKELVAAIAAGGWVAVVVIVIICVVGLIVGSCFGIFFSGEDSGTGQTMPMVIREINLEYENRLEQIKSENPHDSLELSGSLALWPEVLSIYAVKTTTDSNSAQEVASVDDGKKQILKEIFWEMNDISYRIESHVVTEVAETDDGQGHITREETEVTKTTLYISVSHKTAEEMAASLGFDRSQRQQLDELLAPENRVLWSAVLYGIWVGNDAIVQVGLSQVGNIGGQPFWSWYGFGGRVEWCACFVSWCADQCGYVEAGVIPRFSVCDTGSNWFKAHGQWLGGEATPAPGMIIFFDWNYPFEGQDGDPDHVGIVTRVENGMVYAVEGNSGDKCQENHYSIGYYEIYGYGAPTY